MVITTCDDDDDSRTMGKKKINRENKKAFYQYHSGLMEPWDGPAAMAFTDGK